MAPEEWVQNENIKVEFLCGRARVVMEPDKPVVMRQKVVPKLIWHGNWLVRAKFSLTGLSVPCSPPSPVPPPAWVLFEDLQAALNSVPREVRTVRSTALQKKTKSFLVSYIELVDPPP